MLLAVAGLATIAPSIVGGLMGVGIVHLKRAPNLNHLSMAMLSLS
jgi:hypothetical protein